MRLEAVGKPSGCKLLRITAEVSEPLGADSLLRSISVRGDFFAIPEETFEEAEARLCGAAVKDIAGVFDALMREMRVETVGITGAGLFEVLKGKIDELSLQNT